MPTPLSLPNLNSLTLAPSPPLRLPHRNPNRLNFAFTPQPHQLSRLAISTTRLSISPSKSASSVNAFAEERDRDRDRSWTEILRSVIPGGTWWELPHHVELGDAEPVTVVSALRRMWDLVAQDRWVVLVAFVGLVVAAVRTVLLLLLCFLHSVVSVAVNLELNQDLDTTLLDSIGFLGSKWRDYGFPTECTALDSVLRCFRNSQVKRMREKLYSSLLFQVCDAFENTCIAADFVFLLNMSVAPSGLSSAAMIIQSDYSLSFRAKIDAYTNAIFCKLDPAPALCAQLGSDCQQVARVIGNDLNMIFRNVLQGIGALVYLFLLSWPLALSTLATCIVLAFVILLHGQYQKKAAKLTQEFTAYSNESIWDRETRTQKAIAASSNHSFRFDKWLKNLADISLRQSVAYGLWNCSYYNLYHSTQVVAVLIGGASIVAGHITAEQLTKFILYCEWLIYATWWVGDNLSSLMQAVGASEKVFRLMDLLPGEQFLAEGKHSKFFYTSVKLQRLLGRIEFVDVSFHYPSRTMVHILQRVNLSIFPNEAVALVGLSGSGKSTFVNLLLRFYEPTNGKLLVDGFPLKDLDIKWFRENIGYVGQEPRLFRMDVGSNIRYGCPRDVNQEDVELAAKQAYAHDFIMSLPDGYQTTVDDDLLSGGQKQRIAIARALLRDPSILILDEATSALDAESEHNIKGVLRSVNEKTKKKRTVIVIAHRLSTIQAADRIVVLDGGQIVEMGRHSELLKKGGLYARLTQRQADAFA
ncbi:hypothetical protein Syun_024212 [Stephania yunnanensis]|uniref:ABC transporter B family member 26, chloroplastic n=1 Tax=Stephania yunnanensis TaxID=152371 RepID=A0AAP0FAF1_9MAGN